MIRTVGDQQNGSLSQVFQQCGKKRQTRGARQSQAWLFAIGLELNQQLLILREGANFIENGFHFISIPLVE
jgi:hypothetical protein